MVGGITPQIPGAPQKVGELSDHDREIVKFAQAELVGERGARYKEETLRVENFSRQVVAGSLFKFDLVYRGEKENSEHVCTMVVWDKPWENFREVQWERVQCEDKQSI